MHVVRKVVSLFLLSVVSVVLLASCGGGSSSTPTTATPPTASFSYVVTGFAVAFNAGASKGFDGNPLTYVWTFGDQASALNTTAVTGVTATYTYTQPGTYAVSLSVTDDRGVSTTQIQYVTVSGTPATTLGVENWTWVSGSQYANDVGSYVTQFTADARNMPSARQNAQTWVGASSNGLPGKLWMFGGSGYDSANNTGLLSDLWYFTPNSTSCGVVSGGTGGCWTWVGGSNRINSQGVYPANPGFGSAGYDPTSFPGARAAAAAWTDTAGNFWMFGGNGLDSVSTVGNLNDMWLINGVTGQAQWVGGKNIANDTGSATYPRARSYSTTWATTVTSGGTTHSQFWLYGGQSLASDLVTVVQLNDMWMYDTVTNVWTLVTGSATGTNTPGVYGSQGVAAATNLPGSRINAQSWVDGSGTLWMFGGSGFDSASTNGSINDVWSFDTTTKLWTWRAGSNIVYAAETSGTQGTAASGNTPSARLGTVGWTDASGTLLWLFGGSGTDSTGTSTTSDGGGALNELWVYNTQTNLWAFMGGSTTAGQAGVYAVAKGLTSTQSTPGSRIWSNGWLDVNHNFWLFGGTGDDLAGTSGYLSDLWMVSITKKPN